MKKITSIGTLSVSAIALLLGLALSSTVSASTINQYGQVVYQGGELMPNLSGVVTYTYSSSVPFSAIRTITQNIQEGSIGVDVNTLQRFLIAQNKGPHARSLALNGATHFFGNLTRGALAEFQVAVGITPAFGNFDATTRAYLSLGQ